MPPSRDAWGLAMRGSIRSVEVAADVDRGDGMPRIRVRRLAGIVHPNGHRAPSMRAKRLADE